MSKRIGKLDTLGNLLHEHAKVFREARNGHIRPEVATRFSNILTNHRAILETAMLERRLIALEATVRPGDVPLLRSEDLE